MGPGGTGKVNDGEFAGGKHTNGPVPYLRTSSHSLFSMISDSGWALTRGARSTWHRFRTDADALPLKAWRRWLGTLGLGFGVAVGVTIGLALVGRYLADASMAAWDEATLRRLVDSGLLSFNGGIWWESPGNSVVLAQVILAGSVAAAWWHRPLVALSFPLAYGGSKGLTHVAWALWERARPDFVADGVASLGVASYPSGHVLNVLSVYGLLVYLWVERCDSWAERVIAWGLLLMLACVVGLARLRLGAHWPSDVAAGLVLGVTWLGVLIVALRRAGQAGAAGLPEREGKNYE